jgi:hypothetical protein
MTTATLERIVLPLAVPKEVPEGKGEGDMQTEEALIAGFLSGKPAAEAEFAGEIQRLVRVDVRNNHPSLLPQLPDLEQTAVWRVFKMRRDGHIERICPPLIKLIKFLNDAPARVLKRIRMKEQPLGNWDQMGPSNQEESIRLKELSQITASLPESLKVTILAREAEVKGDGPALHEALGIDRRSADKRLARARKAVLRIARGENPDEATEVEDD